MLYLILAGLCTVFAQEEQILDTIQTCSPNATAISCENDKECEELCENRCDQPGHNISTYPECKDKECICGIRDYNNIYHEGKFYPFIWCKVDSDCEKHCFRNCGRRLGEGSVAHCTDMLPGVITDKDYEAGGYCTCRLDNFSPNNFPPNVNTSEQNDTESERDNDSCSPEDEYSISCKTSSDCDYYCRNRCNIPGTQFVSQAHCDHCKCSCFLKDTKEMDARVHCSNESDCQNHCDARCNRRAAENSKARCSPYDPSVNDSGWCSCQLYDEEWKLYDKSNPFHFTITYPCFVYTGDFTYGNWGL